MFKNIVIAGVGGQGTLLASKIISTAARRENLFVRTSETIGMAQRGGSVSSHVRIGDPALSPVIPFGKADLLLGFELAEAARMIPRLKKGAKGVVNVDRIIPANVSLGQGVYLAGQYRELLDRELPRGVFISAAALACKAGDVRTLNVVMLGAACGAGLLPFSGETVREAMKECVKPRLFAMNETAFELGMEASRG